MKLVQLRHARQNVQRRPDPAILDAVALLGQVSQRAAAAEAGV